MGLAITISSRQYHALLAFGAVLYSLLSLGVAFRLGSPFIATAACVLPLVGIVFWYQPFLTSSLFIAFSSFRLHEAYPFLERLKPVLLLGLAAISLAVLKVLLSRDREVVDSRLLRTLCLISLLGVVGVAFTHLTIRGGGASAVDFIAIPTVTIGASISAILWTKLLSSTAMSPLPINMWLFSAYFAWLSVATVVSLVPSDSYSQWLNTPWRIAVMTLAICWLARSAWDFTVASTIFVLSGFLVALVVFYNKIYSISLLLGTRVTIGRVEYEDGGEIVVETTNVLADPNDLALVLLFPLAFSLARVIWRQGVVDAALSCLASIVILTAITFTQSRGALIGVMAVLGVLFALRCKSVLPAILVVVMAFPIVFVVMDLGSRGVGGLYSSSGEIEDSASHRLEAWETAITMVKSRPVRGVGVGNFGPYYRSYTRYWRDREMSAHSMWFQVLAEMGWVGFGLFVAMIIASFLVNARTIDFLRSGNAPMPLHSTAVALQAALAGTCVSGTFLSQAYSWPVYVIVGLIAALHITVSSRSPIKA